MLLLHLISFVSTESLFFAISGQKVNHHGHCDLCFTISLILLERCCKGTFGNQSERIPEIAVLQNSRQYGNHFPARVHESSP